MQSHKGWILTRETLPPGAQVVHQLAVILPSRVVTNKAIDDLVYHFHKQMYGAEARVPDSAKWREVSTPDRGGMLVLKALPYCWYRLTPVDVYG